MKTVQISWSFPTSPYAKTFGFYKTGCYSVELVDSISQLGLAGFSTLKEAENFADSTGYRYNSYSLRSETAEESRRADRQHDEERERKLIYSED